MHATPAACMPAVHVAVHGARNPPPMHTRRPTCIPTQCYTRGIHVVSHKWVLDSALAGRLLPVDDYKDDSEEALTSSPRPPPPGQQRMAQVQRQPLKPLQRQQQQQQQQQQRAAQVQQKQQPPEPLAAQRPHESQSIEVPDSQPFGSPEPTSQQPALTAGRSSCGGSAIPVFAFAGGDGAGPASQGCSSPQWGWSGQRNREQQQPQQQQGQQVECEVAVAYEEEEQEQRPPGDASRELDHPPVPETQADPFADSGCGGFGLSRGAALSNPAYQYPLSGRSAAAVGKQSRAPLGREQQQEEEDAAEPQQPGNQQPRAQKCVADVLPLSSGTKVAPRRLQGRLSRRAAQRLETPEEDLKLQGDPAGVERAADEVVLEDSDLDEQDLRQLESHKQAQERQADARRRLRLDTKLPSGDSDQRGQPHDQRSAPTTPKAPASVPRRTSAAARAAPSPAPLPTLPVHSVCASSAASGSAAPTGSGRLPCAQLFLSEADDSVSLQSGREDGGGEEDGGESCESSGVLPGDRQAAASSSASASVTDKEGSKKVALRSKIRRIASKTPGVSTEAVEAVRARQLELRDRARRQMAVEGAAGGAGGGVVVAAGAAGGSEAAIKQEQVDESQEPADYTPQIEEEISGSSGGEEEGAPAARLGSACRPRSAGLLFVTARAPRPQQQQPACSGLSGDYCGATQTTSATTGPPPVLVSMAPSDWCDDDDDTSSVTGAVREARATKGRGGAGGGGGLEVALQRLVISNEQLTRMQIRNSAAAADSPPANHDQQQPSAAANPARGGGSEAATPEAAVAAAGGARGFCGANDLAEMPTAGLVKGDEAMRQQLGARLAHLARVGDMERPIPLKLLVRPARGSSARHWHGLPAAAGGKWKLQYAEQIQVGPWAGVNCWLFWI
jgi:hypothetical protein